MKKKSGSVSGYCCVHKVFHFIHTAFIILVFQRGTWLRNINNLPKVTEVERLSKGTASLSDPKALCLHDLCFQVLGKWGRKDVSGLNGALEMNSSGTGPLETMILCDHMKPKHQMETTPAQKKLPEPHSPQSQCSHCSWKMKCSNPLLLLKQISNMWNIICNQSTQASVSLCTVKAGFCYSWKMYF